MLLDEVGQFVHYDVFETARVARSATVVGGSAAGAAATTLLSPRAGGKEEDGELPEKPGAATRSVNAALRANALGFATQLLQGTGASAREAIDVADAFVEWLAAA